LALGADFTGAVLAAALAFTEGAGVFFVGTPDLLGAALFFGATFFADAGLFTAGFFFAGALGRGLLAVVVFFAEGFFFTTVLAFGLAADFFTTAFFRVATLFTTRIFATGRVFPLLPAAFFATGPVRFAVTERSAAFFLGAAFLAVPFPLEAALASAVFFTFPLAFSNTAIFLLPLVWRFFDGPPAEVLAVLLDPIREVVFFLAMADSEGKGARKGKQIPLPCKSGAGSTPRRHGGIEECDSAKLPKISKSAFSSPCLRGVNNPRSLFPLIFQHDPPCYIRGPK
jgi:hypothetical protein